MTNTWNKAGGLLLGCVVALGSAACDDGGGKTTTDAGSQDSGSQDSGSQDAAMDAGSDAGSDAGVVVNPKIRLGHFAMNVGSPDAMPPTTFLAHVCLRTTLVSNPSMQVANTLFTAVDSDPGAGVTYTATPLKYGALSAYAGQATSGILNSTATLTRTAQVWAASDIDASMFGTGPAANCVPISGKSPIATITMGTNTFADGKNYTIVLTGRWDWSGGTPVPATDCLDSSNAATTCPTSATTPTISLIDDTHTAPTTGTAWRIINTSTTYAAATSCVGTVQDADYPTNGATHGIVPLIPNPTATANALPVFRIGSTGLPAGTPVLSTSYLDAANIVSGVLGGSWPANTPNTYFSPALTDTSCPAKILFSGAPTATERPANGLLPQKTEVTTGYSGGVAATAVGPTGTANGNIVSVFVIDVPNPANAAAPPVPAQILIRDNP